VTDDETHIRELIERWASAVHAGDMAGVLADHARDIVMFDVPPPIGGPGDRGLSRDVAAVLRISAQRRIFRDHLARHHCGR
jgi:ketosteroid isomerase-like protein